MAARSGLVARRDQRLREIDLGRWQGLTAREAQQRFPVEFTAWRSGEDVARGGGETYAEAGARAAGCLLELIDLMPAGRTALAVTHGGTARGALGVLLGLPVEHWWRLAPLGNACWSVLLEGERGWRLERHNAEVGGQLGPVAGAFDIGAAGLTGTAGSPDDDPVK